MSIEFRHESISPFIRHLVDRFEAHGWSVEPRHRGEPLEPDLIVDNGSVRYAVEIKTVREGRPDRVLASLSQAVLQARRHAQPAGLRPLAIVHVGHMTPALRRKLEQFHRDYIPDDAVGLVSEAGDSHFIGAGLDLLNVQASRRVGRQALAQPRKTSDLFSDLNQWLLKVLLAPELPEHLLRAPRREFGSISELALAAEVSMMSASRFVRRLQEDGFVEDGSGAFRLVRRRELFRLWQSAALRSSPELRMVFVLPATGLQPLRNVATRIDACIGLFAAAEALGLGHVSGVPPQLYVRRLVSSPNAGTPGLVPAAPGESPQLILKQATAPQSVFRGAVRMDNALVSDVLQIWLDAAAHPSRGEEQADQLARTVLSDVLGQDA